MAQAQSKNEVSLTLTGGPTNEASNRRWLQESKVVLDQLKHLLEYLGFNGESTVRGVEPRKGGSNSRDLRVQRADPMGPMPGMLFTSQTSGNDTCWVYRLGLPKDTNLQVLYARIQVALEEGRHILTSETPPAPATNVVQIRHTEPERQVADIGQVLSDQDTMDMLLLEVFALFQLQSTVPGVLEPLDRPAIFDVIAKELGSNYTRRDVGSVIEAFVHRRLLRKEVGENNMLRFMKEGEKRIQSLQKSPGSQQEYEDLGQRNSAAPSASITTVLRFEDHISQLKVKERTYLEARGQHEIVQSRIATIADEIVTVEDRLAKLQSDLKAAQSRLSEYLVVLNNADYKAAHEELERVRKSLSG